MPIEFLGMGATNDGSETNRRSNGSFDPEFTVRLARAHEDNGWDRVLTAYGAGSPDSAMAAAHIAASTTTLEVLVAHRPNVSIPTLAAKTFATLDHISGGRMKVHFITGGNDHEQQREGDYLGHDERYSRTQEYIEILKKVWTTREPFDHEGEHYRFADFVSDIRPVQDPYPAISFGGSSDAAYKVGAAVGADIYCLWGEPLADTKEQIDRVRAEYEAVGRPMPKIQVAFRPILGPTEEQAWERANAIVEQIESRRAPKNPWIRKSSTKTRGPENTGSKRLLDIARRGERFDKALFTSTARATGAMGNSNALVGTPETIAEAMMDYVHLGVDILSARGYDTLQDTIDFGQQVIPLIRAEVERLDRERSTAQA
jgi:alkanesulfonate monooxygenase